jgi:hypothetical protein
MENTNLMFNKETINVITTVNTIYKLHKNNSRYNLLLTDFVTTYAIIQMIANPEFEHSSFEAMCFGEMPIPAAEGVAERGEAVRAEPVISESLAVEAEAEAEAELTEEPEAEETLRELLSRELPVLDEVAVEVAAEPDPKTTRDFKLQENIRILESLPVWGTTVIDNVWKDGPNSIYKIGLDRKMYFKTNSLIGTNQVKVTKLPKPLTKLARDRENFLRKMPLGKPVVVEGHGWYNSAYHIGYKVRVNKVAENKFSIVLLSKGDRSAQTSAQ